VDPGSAATPIDDPRGQLELLVEQTGVDATNILVARAHTASRVAELKTAFAAAEPMASNLAICAFGSWARQELTQGSDDDWAVIVGGDFADDDAEVVAAITLARGHLGGDGHAPGSQSVFGCPFAVEKLVEHIGLDSDTNTNLTRRMLLLLESRELAGTIHADAWRTVLRRYLDRGLKDFRPPRFLLNDLVRYWRTICVDFEGKDPDGDGNDPKWVSRNAKLRTSRKLLFAGGLIPILLCELCAKAEIAGFLERWLTAPPLDRIAAAFLWADAEEEGARAVAAYERWMAIQADERARAELKQLTQATRGASDLFREISEIGRDFERALLVLLLESRLGPLGKAYVVF